MARWPLSKRALAIATGAALVVGGAGLAIGPGAAWIVDHVADGQRVWRLGRLEIEGASGPWLGALRAAHVRLEDENGIWIEADDVALDWRPQALFGGAVWLDNVHAGAVRVLRKPVLTERRRGDTSFDVHISALEIGALDLAEPVAGEAARFVATLRLSVQEETLDLLDLSSRAPIRRPIAQPCFIADAANTRCRLMSPAQPGAFSRICWARPSRK